MSKEFEYPVSRNAIKVAYFDASMMYTINDDKAIVQAYKDKTIMLNTLMLDIAKDEGIGEDKIRSFFLSAIVHETAKKFDDFKTMGDALVLMKSYADGVEVGKGREDAHKLINAIAIEDINLMATKEKAIVFAINAGLNIKEGYDELDDLSFSVEDTPLTLMGLINKKEIK